MKTAVRIALLMSVLLLAAPSLANAANGGYSCPKGFDPVRIPDVSRYLKSGLLVKGVPSAKLRNGVYLVLWQSSDKNGDYSTLCGKTDESSLDYVPWWLWLSFALLGFSALVGIIERVSAKKFLRLRA